MKPTIAPNIVDRNAALPSAGGADSQPNDQGSNPPATANSGSKAPKMVGGSPGGRQTPLPIDGLTKDMAVISDKGEGAAQHQTPPLHHRLCTPPRRRSARACSYARLH